MKLYKYNPITKTFWVKNDNEPECLGNINTLKGKLTREQKLKIIKADGWIEL